MTNSYGDLPHPTPNFSKSSRLLIFNKENFFESFLWIFINDYLYYFDEVVTIFQACFQKGWFLPRFCYHVKLKLSGNCRLCFIEDSEIPKPVISCSTSIDDETELFTHSQLIFNAREAVLEFLLINHPLDCPICDQGGECDLQDQFMVFGNISSRYYENFKKNVLDKNLSAGIKLSLNKCINCARCTRYAHDSLSHYSFSLLGRGENLEISNYLNNNFFNSELSGNVIDLCPVGALSTKFYSFKLRYWELIDVRLIDIFDPFHNPIKFEFFGLNLLRVLPVTNSQIDEEFISDKTRFNFDGFVNNRILTCYYKFFSFYISFSWFNIFNFIKLNILNHEKDI